MPKNGKTEYEKLEEAIGQTTDLAQMIANYKLAIFHEKQFVLLKELAIAKAHGLFLEWSLHSGKKKFEHPLGSCGYTEPKTKKLNKEKWEAALIERPFLRDIVVDFEKAKANLEMVQEQFMELSEAKFYAK